MNEFEHQQINVLVKSTFEHTFTGVNWNDLMLNIECYCDRGTEYSGLKMMM